MSQMTKLLLKVLNKIKRVTAKRNSLLKQNKALRKYRNLHKGQDCIILGAGPSLNEIPHDFLDKIIVIGTNLSFKYHKPDYWVVIDAQYSWMEEGRKMCHELNIPTFINWLWAPKAPTIEYENEIFLHANKISSDQSPNNKALLNNLKRTYNNPKYIEKKGFTSINSVVSEGAIPLALYMGFERIFLSGVDFYTPKNGTFHFIEDTNEDKEKINELTRKLRKTDNSKKDLFDFKRWPIELISETVNKHRIFNLSEKSTVKSIPKIHYTEIKIK
jgi:hypothetical protein